MVIPIDFKSLETSKDGHLHTIYIHILVLQTFFETGFCLFCKLVPCRLQKTFLTLSFIKSESTGISETVMINWNGILTSSTVPLIHSLIDTVAR